MIVIKNAKLYYSRSVGIQHQRPGGTYPVEDCPLQGPSGDEGDSRHKQSSYDVKRVHFELLRGVCRRNGKSIQSPFI
jgi:hypothetical protein